MRAQPWLQALGGLPVGVVTWRGFQQLGPGIGWFRPRVAHAPVAAHRRDGSRDGGGKAVGWEGWVCTRRSNQVSDSILGGSSSAFAGAGVSKSREARGREKEVVGAERAVATGPAAQLDMTRTPPC